MVILDTELIECRIDFMSIRKIPLKPHAYILRDLSLTSNDDTERSSDNEIDDYLSKIRSKVLTDRALYDQVNLGFSKCHELSVSSSKIPIFSRQQKLSSPSFARIQSMKHLTSSALKISISLVLPKASACFDYPRCQSSKKLTRTTGQTPL